ncbi:MAG: hypothetical protein JST47_15590 [Bacteroidetes bacterium]|nr:hypothetical protein [Bacteroidota bacterium]MBS1975154.1 hypothetical protein [Bacteroidota bacterium]
MKKLLTFVATAFVLLFSCQNKGKHSIENPSSGFECSAPQKISVYKEFVYDLSGYADEGGGKPFNLFDENDFVDPRSENKLTDNYIPTTDPQPTFHPSIYFPQNVGSRVVADLQTPYKLSEVYLYDRSRTVDSVWVYTGNMLNWKLKAAFATQGDPGMWGWRKFPLGDSSQYVMIRFSSWQTAITEMVLYGCPYQPLPPQPAGTYNGQRLPKKMMKEFLGVNYFNEVDAKWVKPFHYSRLYTFALDFDNDNANAYPKNKYNMLHNGQWDTQKKEYVSFMANIKQQYNGNVWCSIMGKPLWMNDARYENLRPVTQIGMDPENTMSYARHANMMWNIAAFFGNSKVDTNLLALSHEPKGSGLGIMSLYENGNEDDATWVGEKYCNPVEYFAESSADYDGGEGRLGKTCGIKNADSTARLMTSGMIELDTNRVRVYKFLCNTLRKDKKFIWDGGIQYHHYSTNGTHGITPEEDSLRWKLLRAREATYKIAPNVECFLGENGYDKSQNSRQATPMVPGLSEQQCQGIFILRSINATAFSGFDAYILYWLRDSAVKNDPRVYLTSGVFRQTDDGKMQPLAAWYYISTFVNVLGNYVADEVVNEKGNVWVYKYRNKLYPDSVAYFLYCPTHNGAMVENYKLKAGLTHNNNAYEVDFADNSVHGLVTNRKVANGTINISVSEKPSIVLVEEKK